MASFLQENYHQRTDVVYSCAFWIAQVPFAEFECNQPNADLADLWSTELQFGQFWKKINIYNFHV